jgi:hypothetical protein
MIFPAISYRQAIVSYSLDTDAIVGFHHRDLERARSRFRGEVVLPGDAPERIKKADP